MKYELKGVKELDAELRKKSKTEWSHAANDTLADMYNRGSELTPFDTGELRLSRQVRLTNMKFGFTGVFGYNKEYAPHVEYGYRTRGGGYVSGQHYLRRNVEIQRPLYKSRLIEELKK